MIILRMGLKCVAAQNGIFVFLFLFKSFFVCSLHFKPSENSLKLRQSNYVQFQLSSPSPVITMEIFKMWLESDGRHRKW